MPRWLFHVRGLLPSICALLADSHIRRFPNSEWAVKDLVGNMLLSGWQYVLAQSPTSKSTDASFRRSEVLRRTTKGTKWSWPRKLRISSMRASMSLTPVKVSKLLMCCLRAISLPISTSSSSLDAFVWCCFSTADSAQCFRLLMHELIMWNSFWTFTDCCPNNMMFLCFASIRVLQLLALPYHLLLRYDSSWTSFPNTVEYAHWTIWTIRFQHYLLLWNRRRFPSLAVSY